MNQQVVYQDISQIRPYENNPRNNEAAVGPVAQSIKEFGFRVPILIDGKGTIIAGHTRYEAAKRLGMDKVPCIRVDDLTDAQIKAYRIADNKVAEASSWNDDVLRAEMDALQALDVQSQTQRALSARSMCSLACWLRGLHTHWWSGGRGKNWGFCGKRLSSPCPWLCSSAWNCL